VREIVERHGGTVGLQSRVGKETRFTLTLPVKAPNGAQAEARLSREITA
jgi:signal transduction histidine kinase